MVAINVDASEACVFQTLPRNRL